MIREPVKISVFPLVFGAVVFLLAVAIAGTANAAVPVAATQDVTAQDFTALSVTAASPLLASQGDGAAIYNQSCSACHQASGVGVEGAFPPLLGNPNAADAGYVDEVIRNGRTGAIEVDGVSYDAVMAAIDLSDDDRAAVVEYVVGLAAAESQDVEASTPAASDPIVGDADRGRSLFIGSNGFENGGGACASCHEAGDVGHWGGSSLGPDLDNSFANLGGEVGLATWLTNPASQTMQPVFSEEPLTEAEVADLVAFLETAPERQRPRSYGDALLLGGVIGLIVLLGGMALIRRNMSPSYIQRLRSKK